MRSRSLDGRRPRRPAIRALRQRLEWRQENLGARAGVSQDAVSRAERGRIDGMTVRRVRSITRALDAELVLAVRWRGGDLDRLLDEGHAGVLGASAGLLDDGGWQVAAEVTYAVYGERGSIDLLRWHAATGCLLVVEVKTALVSVEATLRKHDEKVRLASGIASERFGWRVAGVSRLLVLPDTTSARRAVTRHAAVLDGAYPLRGNAIREWLREPRPGSGVMSGLLFAPGTRGGRGTRARTSPKRIRRRRSSGYGA